VEVFRIVRALIVAAGGALVLAGSAGSAGNPCAEQESDYTVHSKGLRVGQVRMSSKLLPRNDKKLLQFAATTKINADFFVYSYTMDSHEEVLVGEEGTIRYMRLAKEQDKLTHVDGQLDKGRFILDIRENGANRTVLVDRGLYDYTSMECPEIRLQHEGEEKKLRILDLEALKVVNRTYRWVKSEDVSVDGMRIHCRVIDIEDPQKRCRRWITPDAVGAIITRQDGMGKGGSYSMRIAHLKKTHDPRLKHVYKECIYDGPVLLSSAINGQNFS